MRILALTSVVLSVASARLAGQDPPADFRNLPRAEVMVLGVFHFRDAGRDDYQPRFPFDIRSPARQKELGELLDQLAAWGPTRVAVEVRASRQSWLDSLYLQYPSGGLDSNQNEIFQVGFALAKRSGHPGVFAVDAPARRLDSAMTEPEWNERRRGLRPRSADDARWDARFQALYRADDSLKSVRPLGQTLLAINDPERLALGHGHYLVGTLLLGPPGDYLGADGFVSGWYNRNLRIYSNIARLIRSPGERVLVLIGAGHGPILRHLLASSPLVRLVEVAEVLR
jgi:hypothetical protein